LSQACRTERTPCSPTIITVSLANQGSSGFEEQTYLYSTSEKNPLMEAFKVFLTLPAKGGDEGAALLCAMDSLDGLLKA
jgi:hypothetical protein